MNRSVHRFVDSRLSISSTVIEGIMGDPPSDVGAVSRDERCLTSGLGLKLPKSDTTYPLEELSRAELPTLSLVSGPSNSTVDLSGTTAAALRVSMTTSSTISTAG